MGIRNNIISNTNLLIIIGVVLVASFIGESAAQIFTSSINVLEIDGNAVSGVGGPINSSDYLIGGLFDAGIVNWNQIDIGSFNSIGNNDTVILFQVDTSILTAAQRTTLVSFVTGGGKLIIWDSDAGAQTGVSNDYSWLPTNLTFNTSVPGPMDTRGGILTITEENDLSSSNPENPNFINTSLLVNSTDAVGDANIVATNGADWCQDMFGQNAINQSGPAYMYSRLGSSVGNGFIVYSALDWDNAGFNNPAGNPLKTILKFELLINNKSNLQCKAPVAAVSISGTKFSDINHNRVRDRGEPGIANWTITLTELGQDIPITTQTDSNGNYTFTGLVPGNYTVGEVLQPGWEQTNPTGSCILIGSCTYNVNLSEGQSVTNLDFGNSNTTMVVVLFVPNATESEKQNAIASVSGTIIQEFTIINAVSALIPVGTGEIRPVDRLRINPLVMGIDKNTQGHALDLQADIQVHANQVWSLGFTGNGVRLAILDTGIATAHPEFAGRIVACHTEISGTTTCDDDNGHGTHVAGIAGAQGVNPAAIGVAPSVLFMIDKVLDSKGNGDVNLWILGIQWAVKNNANIISMSIGTDWTDGGTTSNCDSNYPALKKAIDAAIAQGITVIAAAGNDGARGLNAPGCLSNVIAVGNVDHTDTLDPDSSVGAAMKDHGISAPGTNILSTVPTGTCAFCDPSGYKTETGTSMATPMVSGSVALMLSKNPTLTPATIRSILFSTADCVTGPGSCPNNDIGFGRENELTAINAVPSIKGSISGTKFDDINTNGRREAGDPGIANLTINLKNDTEIIVATTQTDKNGKYTFRGLQPGNYTIEEVLQAGWTQTAPTPVPPGTYNVILISGQNETGKDFGNFRVTPPPPITPITPKPIPEYPLIVLPVAAIIGLMMLLLYRRRDK